MKIIYIVKTNKGAKWAFEQARELSKYGCDLVAILPESDGGFADEYKTICSNVYGLPCSFSANPFDLIKRIRRFREIVKIEKPDVIHTHFVNNTLFVRLAIRHFDIPRLFQVPGPLHMETWYTRQIEMKSANRHDYWGCGCVRTRDLYIKAGLEKERVGLTYYGGYGGETCYQYEENSGILHKEFRLQENKRIIAMISYFYPPKKILRQKRSIKGFEDFIDAVSLIVSKRDDVVAFIIGGTFGENEWYVNQIKEYAARKCGDKVIFTGFRNDLKKVYKEIDIAVHPSHSENLGGAAESLAAGVPTISTNIGGFPDIVLNGITGITVPPRQPLELAVAIGKMLDNPEMARGMALAGRKLVFDKLNIENTAEVIKQYYERII